MPIISGGGGGFNGGTITQPLFLTSPSPTSDYADLLKLNASNLANLFVVTTSGDGQHTLAEDGSNFIYTSNGLDNPGQIMRVREYDVDFNGSDGATRLLRIDRANNRTLSKGISTQAITSGALPTVAPVSGTAFQCSTTRDVTLVVPVTYNPGVATTATCKVELSPDNVTFSELFTVTQPVGTVFDGSIEAVQLVVPAAWRVKLTVTNATLGTGTYY